MTWNIFKLRRENDELKNANERLHKKIDDENLTFSFVHLRTHIAKMFETYNMPKMTIYMTPKEIIEFKQIHLDVCRELPIPLSFDGVKIVKKNNISRWYVEGKK